MKLLCWLRSLFATFLFVPIVTFTLCGAVVGSEVIFKSRKWANRFISWWGRFSCWAYGVKVIVNGEENFPKGGAILLFNHTSFFDILSLYSRFPFFRFGAKLELFSIPIFGPTMKAVGTLPIARGNREAAIRVLQEAVDRARNGEKFGLSPEGARNTEDGLLPFKAGPFLFAIQAQVPLLPIVIRGAKPVFPKGHILPAMNAWRNVITLDVLPAIPTTGKHLDDRGELQDEVRVAMQARLESRA